METPKSKPSPEIFLWLHPCVLSYIGDKSWVYLKGVSRCKPPNESVPVIKD